MRADFLPKAEPTMRTAEVAKALGVSARSVRYWADEGKIECFRTFGGHRLFPLTEVRRVIDEIRQGRLGAQNNQVTATSQPAPKNSI